MKKLLLFLTLLIVGMSSNAQFSPSNNLNYIKLLKNPPIGTKADSVMVFNGTDKFVKMIPTSSITTDISGKEDITNKISVISGYSETLYPNEKATHDGLNMKLNISDLPTNLTLYPTTTASDVSGYVVMVKDIHDVRYNSIAVDVSTPLITGVGQLVSQRISDPGVLIGQPGVFNITTFGNIRHLSGSGSATFYFEVYHRDSAGVETLICTSSISEPVVDGGYAEFTASGLWNNGDFEATDRIVIKSYANRISGGSDPIYQFQFGGTEPVRTLLPVPFSVVDAGYELSANKVSTLTESDVLYPNNNAVIAGLATKQNTLTNPITGTGTANTIPLFTGTNTLSDSNIFQSGTKILVNTNISTGTHPFQVNGSIKSLGISASGAASTMGQTYFYGYLTEDNNSNRIYLNANNLDFWANGSSAMLINKATRNTLFKKTSDNGVDAGQFEGTVSAFPATLSNQVVVKSQLDLKADLANAVLLTNNQTKTGVLAFYKTSASSTGLGIVNNSDFTMNESINNFAGVHTSKQNNGSGTLDQYDSATASIGDLILFRKNNIITGSINHLGELTTPKITNTGIQEYADNAAAITAGLAVGTHYRTGDLLKIVH